MANDELEAIGVLLDTAGIPALGTVVQRVEHVLMTWQPPAVVEEDSGEHSNSLWEDPLFEQIVPHLRFEIYGRDGNQGPRRRMELASSIPDDLRARALALRVRCCACSKPMHPFRNRTKGTGRAAPRHVYVAVACLLRDGYSCARGRAARDAYVAIERAYEATGRVVERR